MKNLILNLHLYERQLIRKPERIESQLENIGDNKEKEKRIGKIYFPISKTTRGPPRVRLVQH